MPHRDRESNPQGGASFAKYQRDATAQDKFCKGCRYNLRGLMDGLCPECGLPFNLSNHRTYLTSDQLNNPVVRRSNLGKRAGFFAGAVTLGWGIPYGLAFLLALAWAPSGQESGFAALGCCMYAVFYPVILPVATVWLLNAVMPESATGISINIGAASLAAGVLISGQLVFAVGGFNPLTLLLGLVIGLPVGLWRARRLT